MKFSRCFPALAACIVCALAAPPGFAQSANDGFDPNVDGPVWTMALQADGKILVGGDFDRVGGVLRGNLARLNVDGTLDLTFTPIVDAEVECLAVQPDGKILAGGDFELLGGVACEGIARLLTNGLRDPGFSACADNEVDALVVQPDGRVIAGGRFTAMNGVTRQHLARLWADGSLDEGFNPGVDGYVSALLLQPDGRIVVGGDFFTLGGQSRQGLGRLNADGSVDAGFVPNVSGNVECLARQVDGKLVVGGSFNSVGGLPRLNLVRLHPDGSVDPSFQADANDWVTSLAVQPDGKILVGGRFTTLGGMRHEYLGRLNADGSVHAEFPIVANIDPFSLPKPSVESLIAQPDGSVLIGGQFDGPRRNLAKIGRDARIVKSFSISPEVSIDSTYVLSEFSDGRIMAGGLNHWLAGPLLTRLRPNGEADTSFNAQLIVTNFESFEGVNRVIELENGQMLVAGVFSRIGGGLSPRLARLNGDGSLDSSFVPAIQGRFSTFGIQADGRILVGSPVTNLNGLITYLLRRLHTDGNLDSSFQAQFDTNGFVVAFQPDGKVLVGGQFAMVNGQSRSRLARLNPDGTSDPSFNASANGRIRALALQPDGRIVVGGEFTSINLASLPMLARLHPDGSFDRTFRTNASINSTFFQLMGTAVDCLKLSADGRLLVGGKFFVWPPPFGSTLTFPNLLRTDANGVLDTNFFANPLGEIYTATPQADGRILVGGFYASGRRSVRLTCGPTAAQSLSVSEDGKSIRWKRLGGVPEIENAWLEQSLDGTSYTKLSDGARIPDGWAFGESTLPTGQVMFLRARGRSVSGYFNSTSSLLETVAQFWRLPPPFLSSVQVLGGGAFQFSYTNTNATAFTVLASTNVNLSASNWTALGTPVSVGNGLYQFTDPAATNHARRFYQIRSP